MLVKGRSQAALTTRVTAMGVPKQSMLATSDTQKRFFASHDLALPVRATALSVLSSCISLHIVPTGI